MPIRRRAAADQPRARVRAALRAADDRCIAVLRRALARAWRARALRETAPRPSRFNAFLTARARFDDGLRPACRPFAASCDAFRRMPFEPRLGVPSFTPARRALESPIAIACLVERALPASDLVVAGVDVALVLAH